jgi:hypothetical protein
MSVGALYASKNKVFLVVFFLFLPMLLFIWILLRQKQKTRAELWLKESVWGKGLYYYSLIFSSLIIVGGFITARLPQERNGLYVFLPVAVYFWAIYFSKNNQLKV